MNAAEIIYWEITNQVDAVDGTSMDSDGWKERIPCLKGAKGSYRSFNWSTLAEYTGVVFEDAAGGYTVTGNIVINKVTADTPVDGAVIFNHEFVLTGSFTAA